MAFWLSLLAIFFISSLSYYTAKRKIINDISPTRKPTSPARFYGYAAFIWCFFSGLITIIFAQITPHNFPNVLIPYAGINVSLCFFVLTAILIRRSFKARQHVESWFYVIIFLLTSLSILITLGVTFIILNQAIHFFQFVSIFDFLFGLNWEPQNYEADPKNSFGIIPILAGTLYITLISLLFAAPVGIMAGVYSSEFMDKKSRSIYKPFVEMMASIPSVVYGYFALLYLAPFFKNLANFIGIPASTENSLAAGIMIGVMIVPVIMSLSDDLIKSIPKNLKEASLALGSTKIEAIYNIVLPAAKPGLICIVLLAASRAIGETMIITMAAGLTAKLTLNPFDSATTFTAQIVNLMTGDESFDSPKTLSAYALALFLFIFTISINFVSNRVINYYKRKYGNIS